ncbi:hypothetical protein [Flavobacterium muglaense]|uniref:Uncharacterized protein n=1 Tax=Flavobacterium muglaense TaxID=2764716 RepID=A0A923SK13_9FLAO|nr:hypothetical protein [Flavobacterium muglaense]MBC5838278.1 hypothetical protein [Flavobacterium muglaense]MBC5844813.1 hypothetical protein [Flavobacterium muglaense]
MFEPDDHYTGKPNLFQKSFRVLIMLFAIICFLWMCYYYYVEFSSYEAGNDIKMDGFSFLIYTIGGKWLNIAVALFIAGLIGYTEVKKMKADWIIEEDQQSK